MQGIVFDFNGVLWWDGPLQEAAWQGMAARLRGRLLSAEEMAVHVHGRTNRHTLEHLSGRPLPEGEVRRLSVEKEALYQRLCLEQGPAFALSPGAAGLLDSLQRLGVRRTIATASPPDNVAFFVEHLALGRWFDPGLIVCDDGRLRGKPAPDLYLEGCRRLGLAPAQCAAVDDSLSGLESARAAGMGCVIALGPAARHAELALRPGVSRVVETLGEIAAAELFGDDGQAVQPLPGASGGA